MFPGRYFPRRYFAARYWPKVGAAPSGAVLLRRSLNKRVGSRSVK